ncbi:FxLYD domain-containing protein [Streptomyces sp. NPDC002838]|uniref:FxLYD domain-containing protein n=1 Tax=Streptomyces sp. NPDC002838 TaxID=3154436 RepID=UPI00332901AA
MAGHRRHWATSTPLTALLALVSLTGCTDDESPSETVSRAASAARSIGAEATAAASSLAAEASEAFASATAEVGRRFDEIEGGVDVKDDVRLGAPVTDGRTTVEVTADNTADSTRSFAVEVDFTDQHGNLLDVVVVTVPDVPAGESGKATARSNRELGADVRAVVGRAVRY